jgi:hypothetical protein
MEIKLYRSEPIFAKEFGKWWSPNPETISEYNKGPLKSRTSKAKVPLDDYAKGARRAMISHGGGSSHPTLSNPNQLSVTEWNAQLDKDVKDLKSGKLKAKDFKLKYPEAVFRKGELNPKVDLLRTAAPAAKQAAKFLGPLGAAYAAFEYLKGTPVGDATLNPNIKYEDN